MLLQRAYFQILFLIHNISLRNLAFQSSKYFSASKNQPFDVIQYTQMSDTQATQPPSPVRRSQCVSCQQNSSQLMPPLDLSGRRSSEESVNYQEKPDLCYQTDFGTYSAMRVYINSIYSAQVKLYYTKYIPKVKQGTICIIHGYGESSDDFLKTAQYFAENNYIVNMIDLRGFGYSGGSRVNSSIKATVSDIETLLRFCCELNLPTYIMAHGFGATMVFSLLQENPNLPISGVIAISPLLNFPNVNRNSLMHSLALHLSPTILDDILINNLINPTSLTKDPQMIQEKIVGFFSYQYVTLKMAHVYDSLAYKVRKDGFKIMFPILICHGDEDSIQPFETVQKFFQEISSIDKQLRVIPGAYHSIHIDLEAPQMRSHILTWLRDSEGAEKRKKIRWVKAKQLNLDTLTKQYHWKKLIFLALLALIGFLRIFKRFANNARKIIFQ